MSKLLTFFFFFQSLSLVFSQQATVSRKPVQEPIWIDFYDDMRPFEDFYDENNPIKEDYAVVREPQKGYCLINRKGKVVTDYYKRLDPQGLGLLRVERLAKDYSAECSIVDLSGKTIVPFGKDDCNVSNNCILVSDAKNKSYKVLNLQGRLIFSSDNPVSPFNKNYIVFKDSITQIINPKGKIVAQTVAKEVKILTSKYFSFRKGNFCGIMNDKFEEVVSPKYEYISRQSNSMIFLYFDKKYGLLDFNLREVIPFGTYQKTYEFSELVTSSIGDGLMCVKKDDYWGYVDFNNKLVIDFFFRKPARFYKGYALQKSNYSYILLDKSGKIVQHFPYDVRQRDLKSTLILAIIDKTFCYVDFDGNVVLKCKPSRNVEQVAPPVEQVAPPMEPVELVDWSAAMGKTASPKPLPPVEPEAHAHNMVEVSMVDFSGPPPPPPVEEYKNSESEYVGGNEALSKFLSSNLKYPEEAKKAGISGKVYIKFKIKTDGTLEEPIVFSGLGYGCDEEAIRLIKAMPKWKPAKNQDRPEETIWQLPIYFNL